MRHDIKQSQAGDAAALRRNDHVAQKLDRVTGKEHGDAGVCEFRQAVAIRHERLEHTLLLALGHAAQQDQRQVIARGKRGDLAKRGFYKGGMRQAGAKVHRVAVVPRLVAKFGIEYLNCCLRHSIPPVQSIRMQLSNMRTHEDGATI